MRYLLGEAIRKRSIIYAFHHCILVFSKRIRNSQTFFLKLWNPPKPSTIPSPKPSPSCHLKTSRSSPPRSGILRWRRFPSSSSWGSQSRVRSEMRRQEELNILTVTNSLWTSSLHLKAKPWNSPKHQATQKLHFNPRRKPMNKQPQKPCKTCNKKPRHPNRTECIACIQKKQREKAREQVRKRKEKEKIRKNRITQKKQNSISYLTKKADELWSKAVKINYNYSCQYCWRTDTLNSHHLFTRARKSTRWDIDNGICLCAWHHTLSHEFSAHQTPLEFYEWLIGVKGQKFVSEMSKKSQAICKVTPELIKQKMEELQDFINKNS